MNNTSGESWLSSHNFLRSHDYVSAIVGGTFNTVLALPLNGYVLVLILTGARERLASDFFPLNLAVSDVIYSVFVLCYLASIALMDFDLFDAYMFSLGFIYTGRPLFQSLICVDCYIGVVHPVLFLRCKPLRYRVACCGIVWLVTLCFCIYSKYTYLQPLYLYGFVIQNLLYLSAMLFCCLTVARALKQLGPSEAVAENRKKSNKVKRKAFKIMLLILTSNSIYSLLFIAAVPTQCCLDMVSFTSALTLCVTVALTTGFTQPILYLYRNGKLICCKRV